MIGLGGNMVNCDKCGYEFKDVDIKYIKYITDIELLEISITKYGLNPAYVIKERLCDNCYKKKTEG